MLGMFWFNTCVSAWRIGTQPCRQSLARGSLWGKGWRNNCWAKPGSTVIASERRHRPGSNWPGLKTCCKPGLGWWQWSWKHIERHWLWAPGSHQGSGGARGQVCFVFSTLSLVNVKDWRNKVGIYWEGRDLLGTGRQGSTNLIWWWGAAPLPARLSLRVHKSSSGAMAPCTGAFHFLPSFCDLPT